MPTTTTTAHTVLATIRWKDDGQICDCLRILVGSSAVTEEEDETIFFQCDSEDSLRRLMQEDNGEDFVVLHYENEN